VVAALIVAIFTTPLVFQGLRGPRSVTEQDLLAISEPGWWDNYVSYRPAQPALDTGVRFGVKSSPGTKYIILPVGSRSLYCSANVKDNGPEFVGWLSSLEGPAKEAHQKSKQGGSGALLPYMIRCEGSTAFYTVAFLLAPIACLGGAVWLVVQMLLE